jgi:hypothetical protein
VTLALTVINHLPVSPFDRAFTQKTQTPLARTHAHTHTHIHSHTHTHTCVHSFILFRATGMLCTAGYYCTGGVAPPLQCACAAGSYCDVGGSGASGAPCPVGYYCLGTASDKVAHCSSPL